MKKLLMSVIVGLFLLVGVTAADACWNCEYNDYDYSTTDNSTTNNGGDANVDVDNRNYNDNYNRNTNDNDNRNYNTNLNSNEQAQGQIQGQAQGQIQGQGQLQGQTAHNEGVKQSVTIVNEDVREHARLGFVPKGETTKSDSRMSDPEVWDTELVLNILDIWTFKNKMWNDMAIHGSYETKVVRTAGALDVGVADDDGILKTQAVAPKLVGFVTVTADDDTTSVWECLSEAMRIAAYELNATATMITDIEFKELNTTSGWTIGFNTVGSASGKDGGATVGGGPGYSKAKGGFESRPYVTLMVTR